MVDAILDKCQKGKNLSSLDYEKLLTLEDENKINQLLNSAKTIRDKYSKKVLLTPTLSIKDKTCEKLLACIKRSEELDIPRVNFFRQYETDEDVINACKLVKENTNLKTHVSISGEFSFESIEELSNIGVDTICCNLSTVNNEVFLNNHPKDTLTQRIKLCQNISKNGIGLSSGLVLGIGEEIPDRLKHLRFLSNYRTLEEIPIINYNTYPDLPTKEEQIIPLMEHLKTIAITRIMYPKITITVPLSQYKLEYGKYYLDAGANSLVTNDILKYEIFKEILNMIDECGLEIATTTFKWIIMNGFQ